MSTGIIPLLLSDSRKQIDSLIQSPNDPLTSGAKDLLSAVPIVGWVFSGVVGMAEIGLGIEGYRFVRKLNGFLQSLEKDALTDEQIKDYYDSWGNNAKRVGEHLFSYVLSADIEEKTQICGYIFSASVRGRITYGQMLRLCSVVNQAFLPDLKALPNYVEETLEESKESNSFINLGLIDNFAGGYWVNEPSYKLNENGLALCGILKDNGWFKEEAFAE